MSTSWSLGDARYAARAPEPDSPSLWPSRLTALPQTRSAHRSDGRRGALGWSSSVPAFEWALGRATCLLPIPSLADDARVEAKPWSPAAAQPDAPEFVGVVVHEFHCH